MALIDDVKIVCDRLALLGWGDLLLLHGLDITAPTSADLAARFAAPLAQVDRDVPGFEDFCAEGVRAIEPGDPARSLLVHALASPAVLTGADGAPLADFPTLAELDLVENYVYAARRASLSDLVAQAGGAEMGVVVFASEYRTGGHTCHGKYADMAFCRTGVARVGTLPARYVGARRGWVPRVPGDPVEAIRVLPARYAAYLAVRVPGEQGVSPLRFQTGANGVSDDARQFWRPVHKLFAGSECLTDFAGADALQIDLSAHHINEKLARIHTTLAERNGNGFRLDAQGRMTTGPRPADLDQVPYTVRDSIAGLHDSNDGDDRWGPGVLVPLVHTRLVEPAMLASGAPATLQVPPGSQTFASSLEISATGNGFRPAPEYMHVRHRVEADGSQTNLNAVRGPQGQPVDLPALVRAGNFRARHYADFTGDGAIVARCPQVTGRLGGSAHAAYSLVTAPDFFNSTDQRELSEWAETLRPASRRHTVWVTPPDTLSDERVPANLQSPILPDGSPVFSADEDTVTAVVSLWGSQARTARDLQPSPFDALRHSTLADDAAGVFAPGWDVSLDQSPQGMAHLAVYGLGSPFPEDAKLCAALATFWPAAAPDATRSFASAQTGHPTVAPMTDDEIGQTPGTRSWDGMPGPRRVQVGGRDLVEYIDFDRADYVESALASRFTLERLAQVDTDEYQRRVLMMTRVYRALGITGLDQPLPSDPAQRRQRVRALAGQRAAWAVLSFRISSSTEPERVEAERESGAHLGGAVYRFEVFRPGPMERHPTDIRRVRVPVSEHTVLYADATRVIRSLPDGTWRVQNVA